MPELRRLSGDQVVRILQGFGFEPVSQRGSHVKLRRYQPDGARETLIVPRHREMNTATLRAIIRQAADYVPRKDLEKEFYRN